jgi:hypothetical protein
VNQTRTLGAIIAVAVTASAQADLISVPVDVGTFANIGNGHIVYDGFFASYIRSGLTPGDDGSPHTLIWIDVAGIVASRDLAGVHGVSVIDAGLNEYDGFGPGADIDFLALGPITPDTDLTIYYEGPNPVHGDEPEAMLSRRVELMDSFDGAQDTLHYTHVSLGESGQLRALLSRPVLLQDLPPDQGLVLLVSEAGVGEHFRVRVMALAPGPGSLSLLAAAALIARPSRRRRV